MRVNLINERKKCHYTQAEISQKLNVSIRHYKALEAGTSDGSVKVWQKLKEILEQPIDFLLEQEVDTTKKPDGNQAK